MLTLSDWLPLATVGGAFTVLGFLKVYGFRKGIIGGGGRPMACRLLGRCPSWSKQVNVGITALFLAIGLGNLTILVARLLHL